MQTPPAVSHTAYQDQSQDSLQGCLLWLVEHHRLSHSLTSLTAGLPLQKNRLTPELFSRAAGRAGFACRVVRRAVGDIRPEVLPAVALLASGKAVILKQRVPDKDGADKFVVVDTFSGAESEFQNPESFAQASAR